MANYDFFSQPQGPNIDISLFGDAALQGARLGEATPTGITSAIRGVTEGINTGLDFAKKYEDIQATQARTRNEEAIAQINEMRAQTQAANQEVEMKLAAQKAKNDLQDATNKQKDLENMDSMSTILASGTPEMKASVLSNPDYQQTLNRQEGFRGNVLDKMIQDPSLPPEVREQSKGLWDTNKRIAFELQQQKIEAANKKAVLSEFGNVTAALGKDATFHRILENGGLKLTPEDIARIKIYPQGLKTINKDGRVDTSKPDNDIVNSPSLVPGYIAVVDGKVINTPVSKSTYDHVALLKSMYKAQGYTPPPQASPSPTPSPSPTETPKGSFIGRFLDFGGGAKEAPPGTAPAPRGPVPNGTPNPIPTPPPGINGNNDSSIVRQAGRDLLSRAATDPDLQTRMVAKGVMNDRINAAPVPGAPVPNPAQGPGTAPVQIPATQPAQPSAPRPKPTPQQVAYTVSTLSPDIRRQVNSQVISNVLDNPHLANLDPLYQAVAAVESGGKQSAKNADSSATGVFQLTDAAAKDVKANSKDEKSNVAGGVNYLNQQIDRFKNESTALFAYRFGPAVAQAAFDIGLSHDYIDMVNSINILKYTQGRFKKALGTKDYEAALKYPLKVLAYRDAFKGLSYA